MVMINGWPDQNTKTRGETLLVWSVWSADTETHLGRSLSQNLLFMVLMRLIKNTRQQALFKDHLRQTNFLFSDSSLLQAVVSSLPLSSVSWATRQPGHLHQFPLHQPRILPPLHHLHLAGPAPVGSNQLLHSNLASRRYLERNKTFDKIGQF